LLRKAVRKLLRSESLLVNDLKSKACPFEVLRAGSEPYRRIQNLY
jgi:hypothetical protein